MSERKALVLGSGLVSRPCIETLLQAGFIVTCASAIPKELEDLLQAYPSLETVRVELPQDKDMIQKLIAVSDVVISLLPPPLHYEVALICIENRKNLVTASYLDDAMESLHDNVVAAGITILVEAGLDPGIDHFIAMKAVDCLKEDGAEVTEFRSWCGGIPSQDCVRGRFKYKFSWHPKGMFLSALHAAKYSVDGKIYECDCIADHADVVTASPLKDYNLECVPNRDALVYAHKYNIQTAGTIFRGTLRYQGFSKSLKALIQAGLTSQSPLPELASDAPNLTWRELMAILHGLSQQSSQQAVEEAVLKNLQNDLEKLEALQELGLISNEIVPKKGTPLDSLCAQLSHTLAYEAGEEDLVLMWTRVVGKLPSGGQRAHESTLVEKGTPISGHSAMSRTVGITVAICAGLLDSGAVQRKGVILPITKDIYAPTLAQLCTAGITITTTVTDT